MTMRTMTEKKNRLRFMLDAHDEADEDTSSAIEIGVFTGFIAGWCSCMVLATAAAIIAAALVYAYYLNSGV